ncbi:MAG: S41 family peptidase [Lewinella sp.]
MKPRLTTTLLCLTLAATHLHAQTDCDCPSDFAWVKETFENNDAGFTYALERKGDDLYRAHTTAIQAAIDTIQDPVACTQTIYSWLEWFRPGHIAIRRLTNGAAEAGAVPDPDSIRATYADAPRIDGNIDDFIASIDPDDDLEGVWRSGSYRIATKRVGDRYLGAVVSADSIYWMPGQIKLAFTPGESLSWYMQDHSPQEVGRPALLGRDHLLADWVRLDRVDTRNVDAPKEPLYLRAAATDTPFVERLDEETLYFRIPSFHQQQKRLIDSTILAHYEELHATPNLILDIHAGTGGSDDAYSQLLPLLYTNPIRTQGVAYYATERNNQRMMDFADDKEDWGFDDEFKAWARESYDTLQNHLGEFVNLQDDTYSVETFDTVYPYPARVAILIDGGNGSTDEQFLLAARQSQKVKLFGQSTFGVLDISNMYYVPSPCGEFELGYSLTRSFRIPHLAIDGVGIQPDYFIGDEVPPWEWVDFVRKTWGQ